MFPLLTTLLGLLEYQHHELKGDFLPKKELIYLSSQARLGSWQRDSVLPLAFTACSTYGNRKVLMLQAEEGDLNG